MDDQIFSPSDFVAVLNQTLEFAYPRVAVQGELSNFRVSKNRWVYFDLKDEMASVKCFGTVYQLPGPLEDGMMMKIVGQPRLHPQFGFSITVQNMTPVGEGSIKKAANLLEAQLSKEGVFDPERKRPIPYPPTRIGLIASSESAAYSDFIKIINTRWGGIEILLKDVQVQGERAVTDVVAAIQYFNAHAEDVDVLVVTRGGGSLDDLAAFSSEQVTRAIAASRIPTLVAIGHERDVSLAERAADQRASTPSNAAELLVPDKQDALAWLKEVKQNLFRMTRVQHDAAAQDVSVAREDLQAAVQKVLSSAVSDLRAKKNLLDAYNPELAVRRGYALVRHRGRIIKSVDGLKSEDKISISLKDGIIDATINQVEEAENKERK